MREFKPLLLMAFLIYIVSCSYIPPWSGMRKESSVRNQAVKEEEAKKKSPPMLLTMTESAFKQGQAIAGEENLKKVDIAGPDGLLVRALTRREYVEKLIAAEVAIEDSTTTFPHRYALPGFMERIGKAVPRDETGEIIVNDGYHDNFMVENLLAAFSNQYPDITSLSSIGKTWQGRDIWALKISDNAAEEEDEPAFFFVGAHHASELLSTEYVLDIIQSLTANYEKDHVTQYWVNTYEIWCVPVANPDGLYRFFHVTGSGRKNGRDTIQNGQIDARDGVDLNRNYPFRWHTLGEKASNSDPKHWWYRGAEAGSEPEVQAMMRLAELQRFVMLLSFHTAATKILVPYTIDDVKNPEPSVAWIVGRQMADLADSGRDDKDYKAVRNLYSVDGTDQDWHYWKYGTLAYIWEGSRHNPPYERDRDKLVTGIRPAWGYLLDRLSEGPSLSGHVFDAESGVPLEAVITVDEIKTFEGEVHTSHPDSGRFDRILPAGGTYHLSFRKQGYLPQTVEVEVGREWKNDFTVKLRKIASD